MDHKTNFIIERTYPNPQDKTVVNLEITTGKELPKEFYDELNELVEFYGSQPVTPIEENFPEGETCMSNVEFKDVKIGQKFLNDVSVEDHYTDLRECVKLSSERARELTGSKTFRLKPDDWVYTIQLID